MSEQQKLNPMQQRVLALKGQAVQISRNLHDLLSGEHGVFSPSFASAITSDIQSPSVYGGMVMNADGEALHKPLGLLSFTPRLSSKAVELFYKLQAFDESVMCTRKYTIYMDDVDTDKIERSLLIQIVHSKMLYRSDSSLYDSARRERIVDPLRLNQIKVLCLEVASLLVELDDYIVNPNVGGIRYSIGEVKIMQSNADYVSAFLEDMIMVGMDIHRPYQTITEIRKLQYNLETLAHPEFFINM